MERLSARWKGFELGSLQYLEKEQGKQGMETNEISIISLTRESG